MSPLLCQLSYTAMRQDEEELRMIPEWTGKCLYLKDLASFKHAQIGQV